MKRIILSLSTLLTISFATNAQTPVWSTDVAPILYNNCASCHNPNGIGTFDLLTYQDAVNKAPAISSAVQTRYMPPWPPQKEYSRLAHERILSQAEIDKITQWAAGGTPQGDPNLAPPTPTFSANGELPGTPDLTVQIPKYTSTALNGDIYQCFVIPSNLLTEKYISAFEAIPGNRDIVHHVIVYADTTGACAALQAASTDPEGYLSFGGAGTNDAFMIGGWVPGTQPIVMPENFGLRLPKNADIVVQIHYPKGSNGMVDSTKLNFFFSKKSTVRNVRIDPILNHFGSFCTQIPATLAIPANQTKLYHQYSNISSLVGDISILGVTPHMHLIGRSINAYGVLPNGDTDKYINIPSWDFSWQGFYMFPTIRKVPQGTSIHSEAFYDNTSSNPYNPSNPPQDVFVGEATTDEMMVTFFMWTFYQSGDENIIIDSTTALSVKPTAHYRTQEFFAPYPNPATNNITVKYYFETSDNISIEAVDVQGRVVKVFAKDKKATNGYHADTYSINDLPNGMYILRMRTSERQFTKQFLIQR